MAGITEPDAASTSRTEAEELAELYRRAIGEDEDDDEGAP